MKESNLFKKLMKNIKAPYDPESVASELYLKDRPFQSDLVDKEGYETQRLAKDFKERNMDTGLKLEDVVDAKTLSELKNRYMLETELERSKNPTISEFDVGAALDSEIGKSRTKNEVLNDKILQRIEEETNLEEEQELEDFYKALQSKSDERLSRWKAGEDIRGEFDPLQDTRGDIEKTKEDVQTLLKLQALRGLAGK
jgi:hypothetical protein